MLQICYRIVAGVREIKTQLWKSITLSFAKVRARDTAVNLASAYRPTFPRQLWGRTRGCFQKGNPIFIRFRHWQDFGTFLSLVALTFFFKQAGLFAGILRDGTE